MKKRRSPNKQSTLCWSCRRACGQCSWSAWFVPVKGWEAKMDRIKLQREQKEIITYTVMACPLYVKDSEKNGLERIPGHGAAEAL